MAKRWKLKKVDVSIAKKLASDLGVSEIIANLLVLRGVKTFNQAKDFFRPSLSNLHDPFLMKDMQKAVKRIELAVSKQQKILIYGDYDVDGTTAVAMMYSFLKKYINNIEYYVPCRYSEGYGISFKGIDYACEIKCSLIIALDCGIRAINQINYANQKGIDFIICDHHKPTKKTPTAVAILNPKQIDCNYPYKELTGCGVGFKLIHAYCISNSISMDEINEYMDLLTVSIGADIVPVTGENRVLSFYGLKQINSSPRIGLKVLKDNCLLKKALTMSDIVFKIAPRINAAGRIDHAKKAVEILVEEDYNKARLFAEAIEANNNKRKDLDQVITKEALEMINRNKKSIIIIFFLKK